MSDLADLYPGFAAKWIDTAAGRIFARSGGQGPALLLVHGHPQTNVMWHRVAPLLSSRFTLVIPDLPGYGWSDVPQSDAEHAPYTKRVMASAMIEVMEALGHVRFLLAGHDRGGRVGCRLVLDHPGRVSKLALLDIVSTWDMWHRLDARLAMRAWHWPFLALPAPFPETVIGKDPLYFFDWRVARGTKSKTLSVFDARAVAHYHAFYSDPSRIHATCEDYRAGRTTDLAHDEADRTAGRKITCPVLAIWGADGGVAAETEVPLAAWKEWAHDVRGFPLDCGHYLAEEAPDATAAALIEFFEQP